MIDPPAVILGPVRVSLDHTDRWLAPAYWQCDNGRDDESVVLRIF